MGQICFITRAWRFQFGSIKNVKSNLYSPFLRHEGLEEHHRHLCSWYVVLDDLARVARDPQSATLPVHERSHSSDYMVEVVCLLVTTCATVISGLSTDPRQRWEERPKELVHSRLKENG